MSVSWYLLYAEHQIPLFTRKMRTFLDGRSGWSFNLGQGSGQEMSWGVRVGVRTCRAYESPYKDRSNMMSVLLMTSTFFCVYIFLSSHV